MNSQSAAQTDADERESGSPGKESSNTGADAKTSSKIMKSYRTKQLFFHFEIGVKKTRRQSGLGAGSQALQPMRHSAGAQPVLVGAPKPHAPAAIPGAPVPPDPPPSDSTGSGASSGTSLYVSGAVGMTDMPPPDPLVDPPKG